MSEFPQSLCPDKLGLFTSSWSDFGRTASAVQATQYSLWYIFPSDVIFTDKMLRSAVTYKKENWKLVPQETKVAVIRNITFLILSAGTFLTSKY